MPNWHKYLNMNKSFLVIALILVNSFLLLAFVTLLTASKVYAQPKPDPPVPCNETREKGGPLNLFGDDEYHSLRPYQASPCNPNIEEWQL